MLEDRLNTHLTDTTTSHTINMQSQSSSDHREIAEVMIDT
jgi:hypothetical protein